MRYGGPDGALTRCGRRGLELVARTEHSRRHGKPHAPGYFREG